MKRAFIVVGAESSGNRLMARILIAAGCHGNGTTNQPSIEEICKSGADDIVIHRSFPYGMKGSGRHWPKIADISKTLSDVGYRDQFYLVMIRDEYCATRSAIKNHHVNKGTAIAQHNMAYDEIFTGLSATGNSFVIITYEGLIMHPAETLRWLSSGIELGLTGFSEVIKDENIKHYQGE